VRFRFQERFIQLIQIKKARENTKNWNTKVPHTQDPVTKVHTTTMENQDNNNPFQRMAIHPDELRAQAAALRRRQHHHHHQAEPSAIVSGDSDYDEDIFDEHDRIPMYKDDPNINPDDLYDPGIDDENEAYVYRNIRGGVKETVSVLQRGRGNDRPTVVQRQVYKPRDSDAVLSCPCCFTIVCMDCQRHKRYENQFRAMFVMSITVDWNKRLVYDYIHQALIEKPQLPNQVPLDIKHVEEGEYFPVLCASCQTRVAALDMKEEVYHFYGCLESA
jgi:hypothetical protein